MTDTGLMLLLVEAMFLMPGKLHVLRKDTTNTHYSIKTELSFFIYEKLDEDHGLPATKVAGLSMG